MKSLCLHSLVILLLQTHVKSQEPCRERNVSGAVGGAVTLHVPDTGTRTITWTFIDKGDNIAITRPGGSLEIQNKRYEGRLSSSSDGSLIITNLQHEDQGTYRAQNLDLNCSYRLSVFRNLTPEDITISSNVTDNTTCEMILTCSVNATKKSNVTVTWKNLNSSDISSPTENVVLVPPSHNQHSYICTASNPVSTAFKVALPREYCERNETGKKTNNHRNRNAIIVAVVIVIIIIIIIIIVVCWIARQKRSASVSGNEGQKPGKDRNKNNVKGQQGPSVSAVTTVYDAVRPLQNGENPSRPAQSKEKGTAKMYKDPHATESKESPSEDDTGNTLYSTVQHVKGKNGKKGKAPKGAVSSPPAESCYATVQLPMMDRNGQKAFSDGGNWDCSTAAEESCYEKVQHPTDKGNPKIPPIPANWGAPKIAQKLPNKPSEPSKTSTGGANGGLPKTPVESCYAAVTLPKVTEPAKDPRTL